MHNDLELLVPPGDLQVELHRAEVVDVHGESLRQGAEQVQHFTGDTPHHHVVGQALQFRHLQEATRRVDT